MAFPLLVMLRLVALNIPPKESSVIILLFPTIAQAYQPDTRLGYMILGSIHGQLPGSSRVGYPCSPSRPGALLHSLLGIIKLKAPWRSFLPRIMQILVQDLSDRWLGEGRKSMACCQNLPWPECGVTGFVDGYTL
jgi:hypothetical protein